MRKSLLLIVASCFAMLGIFSTPAHAQFNASNGFTTTTNACGTYFLQSGTYYNGQGVSVGSSIPVCVGPFTTQNPSAALIIPARYTNATLPACSAATAGLVVIETDGAASPVYNATATGGGSVYVEVLCTGSAWTNH